MKEVKIKIGDRKDREDIIKQYYLNKSSGSKTNNQSRRKKGGFSGMDEAKRNYINLI